MPARARARVCLQVTSVFDRNKDGKIVKGGLAVGETVREMKAARVQPDRRWFGNTRVIGQKELTELG